MKDDNDKKMVKFKGGDPNLNPNEASFSGLSKKVKIAATLNRGKVPKSCRATTMDLAKAMGILGFTSSRWLDMSSGFTPKQELDKAHFAKMMEILKRKKKNSASEETEGKKTRKKSQVDEHGNTKHEKGEKKVEEVKTGGNPYRQKKEKTTDDEIRILHEAYQFLLKRYNLGVDPKEEAEEKNLVSPFMKLEVDEPKKVHVELDLDEENEDDEEGDDSCFGDDVFNSLAAQIQAAALDGGAP